MNLPRFQQIPWRGLLALLGGFLIQLTLGSFYSFGNIMTYMTSYMRAHGLPELTYGDFIIVQSVWGMTQGVVMPISGFLVRLVGPRAAMLGGCFIFSLGTALTYFSLNSQSLLLVSITYGLISSFGESIALIPTMTIGMKWFPRRKGIAMGFVVGGFGAGAFIFNQIQTALLNPDNIAIDETSGYFEDETLLQRVPTLMLVLAAIYFSVQATAWLMITEPPEMKPGQSNYLDVTSTSEESPADLEAAKTAANGSAAKESEAATGSKTAKELNPNNISPREALTYREFYILWTTRFCVVLVTQSVAGFYKAFGQTIIRDDHFLAMVGAVSSVFNCSGRLFFGLLMDRTSYRTAMSVDTLILSSILVAIFHAANWGGRLVFAGLVWGIFFTFPGTFSTQPAVTVHTFGHKHGGTIYGFLFTSDIVNNLLVGTVSRFVLNSALGWNGLFWILAVFGFGALAVTRCFNPDPSPTALRERAKKKKENDGKELDVIPT